MVTVVQAVAMLCAAPFGQSLLDRGTSALPSVFRLVHGSEGCELAKKYAPAFRPCLVSCRNFFETL